MRLGLLILLLLLGTQVEAKSLSDDPMMSDIQWTKDQEVRQIMLDHGLVGLDPEIEMDATELITSKDFPVENHYVTTEDGYILNLVRIPHGRNNSYNKGQRPVVVLQHGLFGSCTNFLTNPVNESLAYILADTGADVWLGNSRGNIYSTNHTTLRPGDIEFWQFSWDEMAKYDLPATIYYILSVANTKKVYYVGHSQGTTIGFIQFGEDSKLASHIKHFFAFAPVSQVGHTTSIFKHLVPRRKEIAQYFNKFHHGQVSGNPVMMKYFANELCDKWGSSICANVLFCIGGFDLKSLNISRLPVYVSHNPAGTSVNNVLHWAQLVLAKQFQAFDYGSEEENMKHYGQKTPHIYDPKKVKVPVAIFRGDHDPLATPDDVAWLLPQLKVTDDVRIPHYSHLDFIWAFDSPTYVYSVLLKKIFE